MPVEHNLSEAAVLIARHGYWAEHPKYPSADWRNEVANEETRQGYWPWVVDQIVICQEADYPSK